MNRDAVGDERRCKSADFLRLSVCLLSYLVLIGSFFLLKMKVLVARSCLSTYTECEAVKFTFDCTVTLISSF